MAIRVGINGFGRIGRNILRAALHDKDLDFVAVNDITDAPTLAHLLKYDSILGNLPDEVRTEGDTIHVAGRSIKVLAVKDPAQLPWKGLGVEYAVESTGLFTDADKAGIQTFRYLELPDSDHYLSRAEDRISFFQELERFLTTPLDGNSTAPHPQQLQ